MKKIIVISLVTIGLTSCTSSKFTYEAPSDYNYFETEGIHENLTEEEYYEMIAEEYEANLKQ